MAQSDHRQIFSGLRVTSLGTLASRVLGMVRDMATAALFGLAGEGVLDAFVVAFRIPNLFRRLFGEGALAASYLPVFAEELERDRASAWQLASVILTWLTLVLLTVVLVAEAVCGLVGWWGADVPGIPLVVGLASTMMPYMLLVCLTAQAAATLHALSHFTMPALAPILLNVCWLIGIWLIAPHFAPDKHAQAYVLAVCIVVAGVVQLMIQLPPLRRAGFRFDYNWSRSRDAVWRIVGAMGPMMFGLAVTQMNTLSDVLMAWGLSSSATENATIPWLGHALAYPMAQGAAATVYFGERLYQFPVGIIGIAVATVIFPVLSRHAARNDHHRLGSDLTLGLRLVFFLAVPGSVGMVLLAHPIAQLLFERGEFTPQDTARTARMITCYGTGVWAFCALPVLVRGYYALGDRLTPVKVGMQVVAVNLALNLLLVWPLAESGLAVSTSISAGLHVLYLALVFSRRRSSLAWRTLIRSVAMTALASLVMGAVCYGILRRGESALRLLGPLGLVFVPLTTSALAYFAVHWIAGGRELALLWPQRDQDRDHPDAR